MAVVCLFLVTISIVVAAAFACESAGRLSLTRKKVLRDSALSIAEAGADYGTATVKNDSGASGDLGTFDYGGGSFSVDVSNSGGRTIITSVGTVPQGQTATVKVEVESGASTTFPDGCLVSKEDIFVSGNASTNTVPASQHQASARTNGDFTGNGNMNIDGSVSAAGTVDLNGNASIYDPEYPYGQSGAPTIDFPSAAAHSAWQNQLIADAQLGSTLSGYSVNGRGNRTLSTPCYIDGNLTIGSNISLTISGGGVCYVTGNITISGNASIVNTGVLAAGGTIKSSGNAEYSVSGDVSQVGLISFAENSEAIKMVGNSSVDLQGLIYAANGGIKTSGNGTFYGALVSAGEGADGGIFLSGNGTIYYPADLLADMDLIPGGFSVRSWLEL